MLAAGLATLFGFPGNLHAPVLAADSQRALSANTSDSCPSWCVSSNKDWDTKCGWSVCGAPGACPECKQPPAAPPSPAFPPPGNRKWLKNAREEAQQQRQRKHEAEVRQLEKAGQQAAPLSKAGEAKQTRELGQEVEIAEKGRAWRNGDPCYQSVEQRCAAALADCRDGHDGVIQATALKCHTTYRGCLETPGLQAQQAPSDEMACEMARNQAAREARAAGGWSARLAKEEGKAELQEVREARKLVPRGGVKHGGKSDAANPHEKVRPTPDNAEFDEEDPVGRATRARAADVCDGAWVAGECVGVTHTAGLDGLTGLQQQQPQ